MKYNKVVIKQIPNSDSSILNLEKYGRSRLPGCTDTFSPYQYPDGKYLTGLDVKGIEVLSIQDEELRLERQNEIQATLDYFKGVYPEKDLSPFSSFWEDMRVKISTDNDLILSKTNPSDILKYHFLIANGFVAPSLDEASNPKYRQANYYCHIDEVAEIKNVSHKKLADRAKGELIKISDNKELLFLIGSYLEGTKYKKTMNVNSLYIMLSDFIEDSKEPLNVDKFLKACKLSIEDLQFKVTIETAIRKKIIKFKDGSYHRGGANLGKNIIDVMNNLKTPEFANEFIQIHEETNQRF